MSKTKGEQRASDIERLIGWTVVSIIVFSGAAFLLLINTEVNADCNPAEPLALGQRFMEAVRCMTPNELGDMLAGLFAPLAFLGLILSVLYQRRDLIVQREVMEAQVAEAARTAGYIEQQAAAVAADRVRADVRDIQDEMRLTATAWLNVKNLDISDDLVRTFADPKDCTSRVFYKLMINAFRSGRAQKIVAERDQSSRERLLFVMLGSTSFLRAIFDRLKDADEVNRGLFSFAMLSDCIQDIDQLIEEYGVSGPDAAAGPDEAPVPRPVAADTGDDPNP